MPESLQAYWESMFHMRDPQGTRSGGNGCWRYLRRLSASCWSCAARADLWPGQQPSETLTCETCGARVRGERGLTNTSFFSSGVGKALAKRRQRHVQKPRQGCRDLSESRNGRARIVKKEFSTRSNRIAHERASCRNRPSPLSRSTNQQAQE